MEQSNQSYKVYLLDQSYYSGKLHSYLRYKGIPIDAQEIDLPTWWRLGYFNTGLMKIPFARAPNGDWLQDSSPMIDWFEERFTTSPILPDDPVIRFFSYLLEDYADEWHWRPAMHYRWSYEADAAVNSIRFREDLLAKQKGPMWFHSQLAKRRQRSEYLKKDGVTKKTWNHVESVYLNSLDWMEAILNEQPFLLGDKPSLVDFGFMGPMFRHYSIDPTPAKLMRDRAPKVYEWVARVWGAKAEDFDDAQWNFKAGELPELWQPLVRDACEAYLPYLLENAKAWHKGASTCSYEVQGVRYEKTRTYNYRVWCREQLQKRYFELPSTAAESVRAILQHYGGWDGLMSEPQIQSGLDPEGTAPVRQAYRPKKVEKFFTSFTGTPWSTAN